jgi:hypothetical protein
VATAFKWRGTLSLNPKIVSFERRLHLRSLAYILLVWRRGLETRVQDIANNIGCVGRSPCVVYYEEDNKSFQKFAYLEQTF